jgi:hypothetical protein
MQGEISTSYVDNRKRGGILAFSAFLGIALFVIRAWDLVDTYSDAGLFTVGAGYFLASYLGQILLFSFKVNKKSLLTVLPQASLFIAMEAVFVMSFFSSDFVRLIEMAIMMSLLTFLIFSTYFSLLMSNIFNVATFKMIPLSQVASTASYIVTVMTVYFITYAVTSSLLIDPLISGLVLFVVYFLIMMLHYLHMEIRLKEVLLLVFSIAFTAFCAFATVFFMGPHGEITAFVPASIVFSGVGLEMVAKKSQSDKKFVVLQYILVIVVAFLINIVFNR